ncbi:ABC transporter ATP-binding protein/permease [Candidatus Saccharibacteria bacterium]|nr:ABC transporter ATP-binding protein/permease [Candidatus Saccharibacteria bacterium]
MSDGEENKTDAMGDMMDGGMSAEKAKDTKKTLKRLISALKPQRWVLVMAFILATGAVMLNLYAPRVFGDAFNVIGEGLFPSEEQVEELIDFERLAELGVRAEAGDVTEEFIEMMELLERLEAASEAEDMAGALDVLTIMGWEVSIDLSRLGELSMILLGIYSFGAMLTYFQEFIMAGVGQKLVLSLRKRVSAKLAKVPLRYYDTHKKGEILSRVVNDLEQVNLIIQAAIMRLFTSMITIIGAVVLMWRIHWSLTLIAVGAIFAGLIITAVVMTKSGKLFGNRQASLGKFNAKIEEYFSGQVEIKAFGLESRVERKTDGAIEQLYADDRKAQFIMFAVMPIIRLANQMGYVLIAWRGATMVVGGYISIGQVVSFFQYVQMSQEPLTEASYVLNSLNSAIASAERVFEVLDEAEELADRKGAVKIKNLRGEIEFEGVKFGYGEELLMKDVSFKVSPGQKVAIVGPTGAGKTTLVNLLMRFYETNSGVIRVDGVDIRDIRRDDLRAMFGMVLQDSWMFEGTVEENIAYGRVGATCEEVVEAAKMARAHHFIRTLPKGYESVMGDEDAILSQGEKQLLCIARCIVADPTFLLLDEATSSVDTRTELHIQKAMVELMKGRTSFVIAHRLSTIRDADVILVMNHGNIVEMGAHAELLLAGGMYAEIYNSQFAE